MCVKYGDVPDSLILPQHSIVLLSDRHRPQEKGGFADIYIGRWMNQVVGIKTFRISGSEAIETMMTDIAKEATLWRRLDHPNVVPFYGLDKDHFELSMVCKWMQNGHIVKFLGKNPSASRPQTIMDIARGLEYLHSEHVGIIHGDLKGVNILIDEHGRACLSDFGLSTVMYDCHTLNTITQISNFSSSLRWTAPEILDPEKFGLSSAVPSREGDVYAFAMVMWEVFTGKVPFPDARPNGKVVRIITSGTRPDYPVEAVSLGLSDGVWSVMKECWAADPTMRPTISQAIASLEAEWFSDVVSTA
ncbi:kinase-like domain-containing protein [Fomitopsis betulina]|nr:kinase-like domain-containing protein [Fomitopsis betulina]